MSDENRTVNIDIQVQGNAEQKYRTITQQLKALNLERDKLIQSKDKGSITEVKYQEQIIALKQKEVTLEKQLAELRSLSAVARDKALQEESKQRQAIAKAELKAIQERNEALTKEKLRQQTGDPTLERQQLATMERIRQAQGQSYYNDIFGQKQRTQMMSYSQQLSNLNKLQQTHWQLWKNTGDTASKVKFDAVGVAIGKVSAAQEHWNKAIGKTNGSMFALADSFGYFMAKSRKMLAA